MTVPFRTRVRQIHRGLIEPDSRGLPRLRVLLGFPALLLLLGIVLVAIGVDGSSSGAYHSSVATGADPQLLSGRPQLIRSDEWNTATSWTIGQLEQGSPEINRTFPGGMDAAVPYDLPRLDWSIVFRPHLIGYVLLDAGHGTAWRWWIGGLGLIAACFVFLVTMLPRRPYLAAVVSVAFFFSPFFQWWYQAPTFWPVVWALLILSAMTWLSRSPSRSAMLVWGLLIAYFTVVIAMGIYAPYIIAVAYVAAVAGIGRVIMLRRDRGSWGPALKMALPILAAGALAAGVTAVFFAQHAKAINGLLTTVYPGQRLVATGSGHVRELVSTFASSFSQALKFGGFLGENSSEASTFFLFGILLIPVAVWMVVRGRRRGRTPWELVLLLVLAVVFLAFLVVPGWDAIAHLLLLDRLQPERLRIGLGLLSLVLFAHVVRTSDEDPARVPRAVIAVVVLVFLGLQAAAAILTIRDHGTTALASSGVWWLYAAASVVALVAISRRRMLVSAIALVVAIVPSTLTVNPVYLGIFDLRTSVPGTALHDWNEKHPGTWVGIGAPIITALLVESGAQAYNGVQGTPSRTMWKNVDPADRYEKAWNRIGYVNWKQGSGEPRVTNPGNDQIVATFDGCSAFAQDHVDFVLSDHALDDPCLTLQKTVTVSARARFLIYDVVSR